MPRICTLALAVFALLVLCTAALADDPVVNKPITPPATDTIQKSTAPVSPMLAEIKAAMETSRARVAELSNQAKATTDPEARKAIGREVSRIKQQVELDILAIQARYARERGDEALAQEIEAAIELIQNPPKPAPQTERRSTPQNR